MVFQVEPHLGRARELLESRESKHLRYACLELRCALERIAYQKLKLRLDRVSIDEIARWQPKQAMERLMELVDEHLDKDATFRMAPEDSNGTAKDDAFTTMGTVAGIKPRDIGKHWQKLGSYLHARMPKTKNEHI